MTIAQFEALSSLLRLRLGPARLAAKLVLVDGRRIVDAAEQANISTQSASNAVQRCRQGIALAKLAVCCSLPGS